MAMLAGDSKGMAYNANNEPIADCFGTKTAVAGTAITRLVPPRANLRARITDLSYLCAATAHTVSIMTTLAEGHIAADAAASQADIVVDTVPTNPFDGSILTGNDWLAVQYQDGSWGTHLVSSVSGNTITLSAALAKIINQGAKVYYFFAPADHSNRRFTMIASTLVTLGSGEQGNLGTAPNNNQPLLVHSNNATNDGFLTRLGYSYVGGDPR